MNTNLRAWDPVIEDFIMSEQIAGGRWQFFKLLEERGIRHFESESSSGLLDKHGVEIYEGDVVKATYKGSFIAEVVFYVGCFQLATAKGKHPPYILLKDWCNISGNMIEVIGNIHQTGFF